MKKILAYTMFCGLLFFSPFSNALNKFTLDVKPVSLIANGDYYSFPKSYYELDQLYHFVLVGSIKRVCFLNAKPEYASLDMLRILLEIHDTKLTWYCYAYSPDYFTLDY